MRIALAIGFALVIVVCPAWAQTLAPAVWTGQPGTVETTAQIMARNAFLPPVVPVARKFEQEFEARDSAPQNPASPPVSQWPPAVDPVDKTADPKASALGADGRRPRALSGGAGMLPSFVGGTLNEFGFFPPDSQVAAGPTQLVMAVNGRVRVFSKAGVLGSLNTTLDNFFSSVMTPGGNNFTCDPRVRYDKFTQKWFLIAIDVPQGGSVANRIVIAVSDGPTISSSTSWSFFQFQQDQVGATPNADTGIFADYPTLGIDKHALYIGCNMFGASFTGTTGFVVRKSSLTAGGSPVVTAFRGLCTTTVNGPLTPQGADNDDPNANEGYFLGNASHFYGSLILRRISDPGGDPSISPNIEITVPTTADPGDAPHRGNTGGHIDSLGDRLLAATVHRNRLTGTISLTTAHTVGVDASGVAVSGGRGAIRWYEVGNLTGTPNLIQVGTIYDSASSNPNWYIIPTIAMSGQGRMLVASTITGVNTYPSVQVSERFADTPLGTVASTVIAKAGTAPYNPSQDTGFLRPRRWGDYSAVVVDPTDDMTLWTIQEFVHSANVYGVEIIKHPAPPPASIVSISPSSTLVGTTFDITVNGASTANSGFFDTDPAWLFTNRIGASFSGGGVTVNSVTFTSPTQLTVNVTVDPAASAGPRSLTITNPDGQTSTLMGALTVNTSTLLDVDDVSGPAGGTVALRATLTYLGNPVAGKSIPFQIGSTMVGSATTDLSGVATLPLTVPDGVGTRTIGASFAGDMEADPVSGAGTLTVTKAGTALAVASGNVTAGQVAVLTATLTRTTDNVTLSGKIVSFTFNGLNAGTGTTNGAGVATVSYTVPSTTTFGSKTVGASFAGDSDYLSTNASSVWSTKALSTIVLNGVSTTHLAKVTLKAVLRSGSTNLPGRSVQFLVNGTPVGAPVTTTSTGLASIAYTVSNPVGTHTLTASFAGDADYAGTSQNVNLTVGKAVTTLAVSSPTVRVGANGTITARLKVGTVPVVGKSIAITLGGVALGSLTTNSAGVVSIVRKAAEPVGTLTISASFAGDETYRAVTRTGNWRVIQATVKVTGDVVAATAGNAIDYGAKLVRTTDNGALEGKTLEFRDSATNTLLGTGVTDATGRAVISQTVPGAGVKRTFSIRFAGDANYAPGSGAGSLTGK